MLKMWNRVFFSVLENSFGGLMVQNIVALTYYMMGLHRIYHMVITIIVSPWYLKKQKKN
jgi:hypothetical protein